MTAVVSTRFKLCPNISASNVWQFWMCNWMLSWNDNHVLHGTKCQRNGTHLMNTSFFSVLRFYEIGKFPFQKEIIVMDLYYMPWYELPILHQKHVQCAIFNVQNSAVLTMGLLTEFDFETASYVNSELLLI